MNTRSFFEFLFYLYCYLYLFLYNIDLILYLNSVLNILYCIIHLQNYFRYSHLFILPDKKVLFLFKKNIIESLINTVYIYVST